MNYEIPPVVILRSPQAAEESELIDPSLSLRMTEDGLEITSQKSSIINIIQYRPMNRVGLYADRCVSVNW